MTVDAVISNSNHRERLTRNVFQANHNLSFSFFLSFFRLFFAAQTEPTKRRGSDALK